MSPYIRSATFFSSLFTIQLTLVMASIREKMIKGVFWSAIEKYSSQLIALIVTMVLARLLSPQEYVVVAIATVLISFLSIFSTMGFGPAIIQRKDLEQSDYDSIYSFSFFLGCGLFLILFLSAGFFSSYYDNEQLKGVIRILSVNLFCASINVVPNALMYKNQRFKEIAKRTLLIQLITGPVSILAAYLGLGVYSLLISPVVTAIFMFVYNLHRYPCIFYFHFSFAPIKKVF